MAHVSRFYQVEDVTFHTEGNVFFTNSQAVLIAKKLARHFKFKLGEISFRKMYRCLGIFHYGDWSITYVNGPSLRVIIHELAHLWQYQVRGWTRHSKPLLALMRRMFAFARRKDWWIDEKAQQEQRQNV